MTKLITRGCLYAAWLLLIGLSYREATKEMGLDREGNGAKIARSVSIVGEIYIRDQSVDIWRALEPGEDLYEGSILATKSDGKAVIEFLDGRRLRVGSDSQLELAMSSVDHTESVVTLIKGAFAIDKLAKASNGKSIGKLAVRTGGTRFLLSSRNDGLRVSKKASSSGAVVEATSGKISVASASGKKLLLNAPKKTKVFLSEPEISLDSLRLNDFLAAEDEAKPVAAAFTPDPAADALALAETKAVRDKGFRTSPLPGSYWSNESLLDNSKSFDISVTVQKDGFVGLEILGNRGKRRIPFRPAFRGNSGTGKVVLQYKAITRVARPKKGKYFFNLVAIYREGTSSEDIAEDSANKVRFSRSFAIGSVEDFPAGPVALGFKKIENDSVTKNWHRQYRKLPPSSMVVVEREDLETIFEHVASSGVFSLSSLELPKRGNYLVRDGELAAWMRQESGRGDLASVQDILEGDFTYRGNRDSLVSLQNNMQNLRKLVAERREIFVLSEKAVARIEGRLLLEKPQAAQLVIDRGEALFRKRVEIISVGH